jgi:Ni/Fe-hydrogenase subunit HybB-like protein
MKRQLPRQQFHLTVYHWWVIVLATAMGLGAIGGLQVFAKGLVVTNLTDLVPWGLWITIDLSSIALSAGAFMLCAAVYLLGLRQFQPVARTATFIGLIGYSMAVLCLMLDIGRPDRFWHALVYWNTHSVLWEVTMCVTLYFSVLVLETLPILGQAPWLQSRFPWIAKRLESIHHLAPILAIAGLCLSLLHQSSLGATYGVLKARPIWYRPDLSVLFIVSAMAAGPSLTLLATMIVGRLSSAVKVNDALIERLAQFIGWVLVGYLYFRFWDAFAMTYTYEPGRTEGLQLLTNQTLAFNFWVGEIGVGVIAPIVLLLVPRFRQNILLRMLAFAMVVGGVVAYRWDTNLVGQMIWLSYLPKETAVLYASYWPSLVEYVTRAGIVAYRLLAFTLGARYLGVVDHTLAQHTAVSHEAVVSPEVLVGVGS